MSAATATPTKGTKIFGFVIPVSQNVLGLGLAAIVAAIGAYTFLGGSSDDVTGPVARPKASSVPAKSSSSAEASFTRRSEVANKSKQGVLKIKPVDPSTVVDPTLKLELLDRVRSVKLVEGGRNLFEAADAVPVALPPIPTVQAMLPKPFEPVGPKPPAPPAPPPPVNIPLRYYGFVRPSSHADGNRGYFMDGDNILMATEGDVLKSRFLVVALSPNVARVEDIQLKQGQDLQLIPEAVANP